MKLLVTFLFAENSECLSNDAALFYFAPSDNNIVTACELQRRNIAK
jgi:sugar lactone lactonase YvrE